MFKPLIQLLAIFAAHNQLETKLDLFIGDDKVGTGIYKESKDHHGNRTSEFRIYSTRSDGSKIRLINTKVIDSKAFPIMEEEQIDEDLGRKHASTIWKVRYTDNGTAIFSETVDKVRYADRIKAPPAGYSRADSSDLWFTQTVPLPGTTVTSTSFAIEAKTWQVVETTYIGRKWITVGGRQIEANEVRDIRDGKVRRVFLDDKGQPVLMNNGKMRTEKHF